MRIVKYLNTRILEFFKFKTFVVIQTNNLVMNFDLYLKFDILNDIIAFIF